MTSYILIGDSGHAKVIEDCIVTNGDNVIAKLDDKFTSIFEEDGCLKGPLSIIHLILNEKVKVIIAIGNNKVRKEIVDRLNIENSFYGTIIHPSAIISSTSIIEPGTVIMPNVVVNAEASIGKHSILNTAAIIEHDCVVEDFVHISPGTVLTGAVHVGEGTQIGAKSVAIPLVKIGDWSMIGAGSTIIKDLESNITAVGSPAKVIRKKGN